MIRIKYIFATIMILGIPTLISNSSSLESRIASGIAGVSALIFTILSIRDIIKDRKEKNADQTINNKD